MPKAQGDFRVDVAIIGGGYTGVSAALTLAARGVRVAVLEAETLGWGASGRNGGFCCLGGGRASDAMLDKAYGRSGRLAFRRIEMKAVAYVEELIATYGLDVDRHSEGETGFAHRPREMAGFGARAKAVAENYGVTATIIEKADLEAQGMRGGSFYGAMTIPIGFGLNPRKYLSGLVSAAAGQGALLFEKSAVRSISKASGSYRLTLRDGAVDADQVIVATNGYSSENLPDWLEGRYMPTQSTVLVTRPLSESELHEQGWTTQQMSYDSRNLLHYFRLMPDRRFLFGMRGGLFTGDRSEIRARARTRADFERMFPAWSKVETTHSWSGLVSLAWKQLPFVGPVPENPGVWAALCYHGNGVAMGSYAGKMIAELMLDRDADSCPKFLQSPLARFPFGRARRLIMPPAYATFMLADLF
jgi:glycine/D-amino acid oxidase-like deaminating enzyme